MCAKISFFRIPEHRKYNYAPRYYDPRKERLEELYKKYGKTPEGMERAESEFRAEERAAGNNDHYVPGSLIQKAYRNTGDRYSEPKKSPIRYLIGFCTLVAAMLAALYLAEGLVKILH